MVRPRYHTIPGIRSNRPNLEPVHGFERLQTFVPARGGYFVVGTLQDVALRCLAEICERRFGSSNYETVKSRHLFRDLIDATALIDIGEKAISVQFQKRAHNPLLLAAGLDQTNVRIPWLGNKPLQLVFG